MFKKPKRNIRRRVASDGEGSEDDDVIILSDPEQEAAGGGLNGSDTPQLPPLKPVKEKKKKKKSKEKVALSFGDEEEDTEVFQVKKSSHSRRLAKQLERDRLQRQFTRKMPPSPPKITVHSASNDSSQLPCVVETPAAVDPPADVVLTGREAEFADHRSSDEEPPDASCPPPPRHNFSSRRGGDIKLALKDGVIPDAAMIHAVRKRREEARRTQSSVPDYIPINKDASNQQRSEEGGRDDDSGPEEERVNFTVSTLARDRQARQDKFNTARDQDEERGLDDGDAEAAFWENQQLKKAFAGSQLQKSAIPSDSFLLPLPGAADRNGASLDYVSSSALSVERSAQRSRRPLSELTPVFVRQRLSAKLSELREVQTQYQSSRDRALDGLVSGQTEIDRLDREAPRALRQYQYYQDIRGYVTDLIECFNEKMELIEGLEERMLALYEKHCQHVVQRRRHDIKDQRLQLEIANGAGQRGVAGRVADGVHCTELTSAEVESRRRRTAEREGRRTRRRRARELSTAGGAAHHDGMSSDDEMSATVVANFNSQRDAILAEARTVFEDVNEEFSSLQGITTHFVEWRRIDFKAYKEAYVNLSLPMVLLPLVRLQMLDWNPFYTEDAVDLESYPWFRTLAVYGAGDDVDETVESLRGDPDSQLLSHLVERAALPRLTSLVRRAWDPMSHSQSLRLAHTVRRLFGEYPTVAAHSKPLRNLLQAVVDAFSDSMKDDLHLPRYSSAQFKNRSSTPATAFFFRQFNSCVKLLVSLACWTDVLSDACLQRLCLVELVNARLLMPLTQVPDHGDAIAKCRLIADSLPRGWFQGRGVPHMGMLISYLSMLSSQIANSNGNTDHLREIAVVLGMLDAKEALKKVTVVIEKRSGVL